MILYEYGKKEKVANLESLEDALQEIWKTRRLFDKEDKSKKNQQYLRFDYRNQTVQARKYVGVIKTKEQTINILPKIFKGAKFDSETDALKVANMHLLWWLSYGKILEVPRSLSNFESLRSDFFEVLIYLFATYTKKEFSKYLYQTYDEKQLELTYLRGQLDFPRYIQQNISKARWHKFNCRVDQFDEDNIFNKLVKFVCKLLLNVTKEGLNRRLLKDILFQLADVKDGYYTIADCQKVRLNPMFKSLYPILDYCKLFLSGSTITFHNKQLEVFAFLLPMEKVFEQFIGGFIRTHFADQFPVIKTPDASTYLTQLFVNGEHQREVFRLELDILLVDRNNHTKIIDTKYKLIHTAFENPDDFKYGVAQSDLYQMLAYGVRKGCSDIVLLYPLPYQDKGQAKEVIFEMNSLQQNSPIKVRVFQMPVVFPTGLTTSMGTNNLVDLFKEKNSSFLVQVEQLFIND